MIFVKSLVVEVHDLEIFIGRLRAAFRRLPDATVEPGGLRKICPKKICFWATKVGNDKTEGIRDCILLILESTGQPYGAELELANNVLCGWVIREAVTEPKTTPLKRVISAKLPNLQLNSLSAIPFTKETAI